MRNDGFQPPGKTRCILRLEKRQSNLLRFIELGDHFPPIIHKYNILRRELRSLYIQQQQKLWDEMCENVTEETDSKKFWSSVMRMMRPQLDHSLPTDDQQGFFIKTHEEIFWAFSTKLGKQFCISDVENRDFDTRFEKELTDRWLKVALTTQTTTDFESCLLRES